MPRKKVQKLEDKSDEGDASEVAKIVCSREKCGERGNMVLCYLSEGQAQCKHNPEYVRPVQTRPRNAVHIDKLSSGKERNRYTVYGYPSNV